MGFVIYFFFIKFCVLRLIDTKLLISFFINYTECQTENIREEESGSKESVSVTKVSL